jgi:integrase
VGEILGLEASAILDDLLSQGLIYADSSRELNFWRPAPAALLALDFRSYTDIPALKELEEWFCSARQFDLESVKAYHVGSWLDQHPGSRSTQRQHLAAVRLLFDSLMMRGIVEYNPAARAKPPRLVRESSHTPVFEEAEIVTFLESIYPNSLKDIRDKAIFCVLLYSWCRVSALINLSVADYYKRGGTRWLRFQEKRGQEHEVPVHSKAKEAVDLWLERSYLSPSCSTISFLRQEKLVDVQIRRNVCYPL